MQKVKIKKVPITETRCGGCEHLETGLYQKHWKGIITDECQEHGTYFMEGELIREDFGKSCTEFKQKKEAKDGKKTEAE